MDPLSKYIVIRYWNDQFKAWEVWKSQSLDTLQNAQEYVADWCKSDALDLNHYTYKIFELKEVQL